MAKKHILISIFGTLTALSFFTHSTTMAHMADLAPRHLEDETELAVTTNSTQSVGESGDLGADTGYEVAESDEVVEGGEDMTSEEGGPSEEELAEMERERINENYEAYAQMDTATETKKIVE